MVTVDLQNFRAQQSLNRSIAVCRSVDWKMVIQELSELSVDGLALSRSRSLAESSWRGILNLEREKEVHQNAFLERNRESKRSKSHARVKSLRERESQNCDGSKV